MTKEICIEVDSDGRFCNTCSFLSLSQPGNSLKSLKISFFCKWYNLGENITISVQRIDCNRESDDGKDAKEIAILKLNLDSFSDSKVAFTLKNVGVYQIASDKGHSFILQIQPRMQFTNGTNAELQQMCLQTVVPKWLGELHNWEEHFDRIANQGFNAIYLLPMQEYGSSRSPYSIVNHHQTYFHQDLTCLQRLLNSARQRNNLIFISDVVLNHAAFDAPWLIEHPECTFNLQNTPELSDAYALECVLMDFSRRIAPFQPTWENIDWLMRELEVELHLKLEFASCAFLTRVIRNVKSHVIYERIQQTCNGPITEKSPLVPNYFTKRGESKHLIFANNGWTFNSSPTKSIPIDCEAYLYREIVPWTDCVKLNYGAGMTKKENSWLWNYMKHYIENIADTFDGIRIDNCHSTPLHVAKFLLSCARRRNPNLIVVAELFTNNQEIDAQYTRELGINLLTREAMHFNRASDYVCGHFEEYSLGQAIGSFKRRFPSRPWSLMMDCSHDNETCCQSKTVHHSIPNMAICSFYNCSIGSTLGYDDLNPQKYNLTADEIPNYNGKCTILGPLRRLCNNLHRKMSQEKCDFYHSECLEGDKIVKITRANDKTGKNFTLFAYPAAFPNAQKLPIKVSLHSEYYRYSFAWYSHQLTTTTTTIEKQFKLTLKRTNVNFEEFTLFPGNILILEGESRLKIPKKLDFSFDFDLNQLNILMYRHSNEEFQAIGWESYNVPGYGKLFYCGFQSVYDVLAEAFATGNLNHPICCNIRQGNWFVDWLTNRLELYELELKSKYPTIPNLIATLQKVKKFPIGYRPIYLYKCIRSIYNSLKWNAFQKLSVLQCKNQFIQLLSLTSIQLLGGNLSSAQQANESQSFLAAGLPHFCTECYRCWARDTFVSFRGLFLLLGRIQDAENHLLAFASCFKNGMIPNLLDGGRFPRFNSRDATWWFLQAVKEYCIAVGNNEILQKEVTLRFSLEPNSRYTFPSETKNAVICNDVHHQSDDDCQFQQPKATLLQIILAILEAHLNDGIHFQEDYPFHDSSMHPKGRQIDIYTCKSTGFIYGGNEFNAGTWMDKMNSASQLPSTPRNGANIEIVALCYSFLDWFSQLPEGKDFEAWKSRIEFHFDSEFYSSQANCYLDTLIPSLRENEPLPLRPNFLVALEVSPSLLLLCPREHLHQALEVAKTKFLPSINLCKCHSGIGLKSVDSSHDTYSAKYNACNDDSSNYHNGPEWLWLMGKYLLLIAKLGMVLEEPVHLDIIRGNWKSLCESRAKGLSELTNANGEHCEAACETQAWSNAVFLELMWEMMDVEKQKK